MTITGHVVVDMPRWRKQLTRLKKQTKDQWDIKRINCEINWIDRWKTDLPDWIKDMRRRNFFRNKLDA